ncbi:hypothetical protein C2W64_00183 [Brevibacillus laterosporus]|nr:C40 family peptidase [Brevibacillus laterosporus]RAP31011.1 hypothetical protein C2W64_00183 [Brevibacillus laterosporus]
MSKKITWKMSSTLAVLMVSSLLADGQAFASTKYDVSPAYAYSMDGYDYSSKDKKDCKNAEKKHKKDKKATKAKQDADENTPLVDTSDDTNDTEDNQTDINSDDSIEEDNVAIGEDYADLYGSDAIYNDVENLAYKAGAVNTDKSSKTSQKATSASTGQKIIAAGEKYLGVPYKYASGRKDKSTMDCSAFTMWAYKEGAGINLGTGGARSQYKQGTPISRSELQVGDLVFFSTKKTMKYSKSSVERIGHVGIYAGNNKVLHTYGKGGVTYSNMSKGWWNDHFERAARF